MKILVSACLMGLKTRYDGRSREIQAILDLSERYDLIPICPEQLGGLSTPRPRCSIVAGTGDDVLNGFSRVETDAGVDVSAQFISGAEATLEIAQKTNTNIAVLTEYSPSCATRFIKKNGQNIEGRGVTAALLHRNDIKLISSLDCEDPDYLLRLSE